MNKENDIEELIENAYWEFDAKVKGYYNYNLCKLSERDTFKCVVRALLKRIGENNE